MALFVVTKNLSMKTKAIGLEGANLGGLWSEGKVVDLTKEQVEAVDKQYGKGVLVTQAEWEKMLAKRAEKAAEEVA